MTGRDGYLSPTSAALSVCHTADEIDVVFTAVTALLAVAETLNELDQEALRIANRELVADPGSLLGVAMLRFRDALALERDITQIGNTVERWLLDDCAPSTRNPTVAPALNYATRATRPIAYASGAAATTAACTRVRAWSRRGHKRRWNP